MADITDTRPDRRSSKAPTSVDSFIGRRIQQRRIEMGISQFALAAKVGLTFQQIQKFEAGSNRVAASRLADIAAVLNAAPGDFFPIDGEQVPILRRDDITQVHGVINELIAQHRRMIADLFRLQLQLGHVPVEEPADDNQ